MALKLGAYTACLHDRTLTEALDVLRSNGLTSVEVNTRSTRSRGSGPSTPTTCAAPSGSRACSV